MDAAFKAAPAARPGAERPLTASQQADAEMDEFERLLATGELDNMNTGHAAAPAGSAADDGAAAAAAQAAPPVMTASQQADAEMDEFERRLALGPDPPMVAALPSMTNQPGAQPVLPVMTASQQADAEMDEFERQLALGIDPPAAAEPSAPVTASQPAAQPVATAMTASQQADAEIDEFERRLALGDDPPAAPDTAVRLPARPAVPVMTASQQADAEMDDFERRLAFGDAPHSGAAAAPVTAHQQAVAEVNEHGRQVPDGAPDVAAGPSSPKGSQPAADQAGESERQLGSADKLPAGGPEPGRPLSARQQVNAAPGEVHPQLFDGDSAPQTATPSAAALPASGGQQAQRVTEAEPGSDTSPPASKRARLSVGGPAELDQAARRVSAMHEPHRRVVDGASPLPGSQAASRPPGCGQRTDASSGPHAAAVADAIRTDTADDDADMDYGDMDDDELLRLVMTQTETQVEEETAHE